MRQGPNGKRLRGRGSGGRKPSNIRTQHVESNGPDVKVRGNAQQVVEKYLALARDATSAGDRVAAESYFQHAEHYVRQLNAAAEADGRNAQNGSANGSGNGRGRGRNQADESAQDPGAGPQPDIADQDAQPDLSPDA